MICNYFKKLFKYLVGFVQQDGQVTTVTRMSMNAVVKVSAATVTVQILLVVSTVLVLLLSTV